MKLNKTEKGWLVFWIAMLVLALAVNIAILEYKEYVKQEKIAKECETNSTVIEYGWWAIKTDCNGDDILVYEK